MRKVLLGRLLSRMLARLLPALVVFALIPGFAEAHDPNVPQGLTATSGDGTMVLRWTVPVSNASEYEYRYSSSPIGYLGIGCGTAPEGAPAECVWHEASTSQSDGDTTITGLPVGTPYYFQVRAVADDDHVSAASPANPISATQLATPVAVTNLEATAGNAEVTLTWTHLADYAIVNYQYRQDDGSGWTDWENIDRGVSDGTATGTVTGLTNGTTYSFQVRGTNSIEEETKVGPDGGTVTATPSGPPGAVELRADEQSAEGTKVRLYWSNPDDSTITGYQISQQKGDGPPTIWRDITFPDTVDIATDDPIEYTVTGLISGDKYTFEVRAINDEGDGATASVEATPTTSETAPAQMSNVEHTVSGVSGGGGGAVTFTWAAPNDVSINKYQYRYKCENTPPQGVSCGNDFGSETWNDVSPSDASTTTFTVSIPGNNAAVFFQLRAVNTTPNTDLPGTETAVTVSRQNDVDASPEPPGPPTGLTATATPGQVALSWTVPSGTLTKFQYRQSADGGSNWDPDWSDIPESDGTTASYDVTGLTNGVSYVFEVRAVAGAGTDDDPYVYGTSARAMATTPGAPNAPTGLTVASVNDDSGTEEKEDQTQLELSWTEPTPIDGVTVSDYEYRKRTDGATRWDGWTSTGSTDTSHTVKGLADTTSYDFQVRALAGTLVGAESNTARGTTAISAGISPPAPTGLTATGADSQVTLRWAAPEPPDPSIRDYLYQQCVAPADCTDDANFSGDMPAEIDVGVAPDATSYTVVGLTNGTAYTFRIKARNVHGTSDASNPATATPREKEDPAVVRVNMANQTIMPEITRTMTASTLRAVTGRIESVASGATSAAASSLSLNGQSDLYHVLKSNAQAVESGTLDLARLLGNSSFALPLNASEDGNAGGGVGIGVWGSGDYLDLSGGDAGEIEWEGDVVSGHLGVDARLGEEMLVGLFGSHSEGTFEYTDRTTDRAISGDYDSSLTSVNPYVSWSPDAGLDLWVTGGYGWGEIEVDDDELDSQSSDMTQWSAAGGARVTLLSSDEFAGGTTRLKLKGEGLVAQADIDGNGRAITELTVDVNRLRLGMEGSHAHKLATGGTFTPAVEVGIRHDGGDGETGTGVEAGGSLRYQDPGSGLTLEARGRTLLSHSGDYDEWGVGGLVRIDPGVDKRGLSLSLVPTMGAAQSGVQRLWNQGMAGRTANDNAEPWVPEAHLNAELGYGSDVFAGKGTLTPYGGFSLASEEARSYILGARLEIASGLDMSLEGTRRESENDGTPEHDVMFRGQMWF